MLDEAPDLAMRLYDGFERAKLASYERAREARAAYLLFPEDTFAREAELFGSDPYPSGLAANRRVIELLAGQSRAEGIIPRAAGIDGLFHPALRLT